MPRKKVKNGTKKLHVNGSIDSTKKNATKSHPKMAQNLPQKPSEKNRKGSARRNLGTNALKTRPGEKNGEKWLENNFENLPQKLPKRA